MQPHLGRCRLLAPTQEIELIVSVLNHWHSAAVGYPFSSDDATDLASGRHTPHEQHHQRCSAESQSRLQGNMPPNGDIHHLLNEPTVQAITADLACLKQKGQRDRVASPENLLSFIQLASGLFQASEI